MKRNFLFVITVILLIVLLSLISISVAYFSSQKNINGQITLGEVDFILNADFDNSMLATPNAKVLCDMVVYNKKENGEFENLIPIYLRFKISAVSNDVLVQVDPIFNQNNWYYDGEFYYYKKIIYKNESVDICDNVLIDKNTGNNVQGNKMEINLLFEAIQYNAANDLWGSEVFANLN